MIVYVCVYIRQNIFNNQEAWDYSLFVNELLKTGSVFYWVDQIIKICNNIWEVIYESKVRYI